MPLKQQLRLKLKPNNSFEKTVAASVVTSCEGVLLLAVSGGADSTAMTVALSHVVAVSRLHCLHVEHGIRSPEESRGDADFVADLCKQYGLALKVVAVPHGKIASFAHKKKIGIEAAARFFRHSIWNREASRLNAERILVAHTKDDLLELILMRVLRGSGAEGLAPLAHEDGKVLRPLLSLTRHDVTDYLTGQKIPYRTDSTNADVRYLRNRVRHTLIPLLNEHFPYWKKTLYALAETQSLIADFLKTEAQHRITWRLNAHSMHTDADKFFSQGVIIREESCFHAINEMAHIKKTVSDMPDAVKQRVRSLKRENIRHFARGDVRVLDAGTVRILHRGKDIVISPVEPFCEEGFSLLIQEPGLYMLKGLCIECTALRKTEPVFCIDLPAVIHSGVRNDLLYIEDKQGCAAKIVHGTSGINVKPRQKTFGVFFISVYHQI